MSSSLPTDDDLSGVPFAEATAVKRINENTYTIDLQESWCIGNVPNGGYTTACLLSVTQTHFSTTLARQSQPHPLTLHVEFPRRTERGPATFTVQHVKLGRATSTVHITLTQHDRAAVIAYITMADLAKPTGADEQQLTLDTQWRLEPPPPPVSDWLKLETEGGDENWKEIRSLANPKFRKAANRVRFFFPRRGKTIKGAGSEQWMTLREQPPSSSSSQSTGGGFTTAALGYVADIYPLIVETFDRSSLIAAGALSPQDKHMAPHWYPTLTLDIEIKRALPAEGVRWLYSRTGSKSIRNGRMDVECVICNSEGELVAVGKQVAFALSAERNTAAIKKGNGKGDSKI